MRSSQKNPLVAFLLGFLFLGAGLFYVFPPKKALPATLITLLLLVMSGGTLWVPLGLGVGLLAARKAHRGNGLAFHGDPVPELRNLDEPENLPHLRNPLASGR